MNTYRKQVHQLISNHNTREEHIWHKFQAHSAAYARALDLSYNNLKSLENLMSRLSMYPDLKEISNTASVISVEIDGNEYVISCKKVCGAAYGGHWDNFLFGVCVSDPAINTEMGCGTTLINVLPDNIHSKLCEELRK